jgi:putative hydrolase of the HAD superfamily
MPRIRAVLFDLCDTLVHFDAERLPLIEIDNQPTRSTALAIHHALGPDRMVTFEAFFSCLKTVTAEIAGQRDVDHREVPSQERFRRVLERLGLSALPGEASRLVDAHMTRLAHALVTPEHHLDVLETLAGQYRLGIITNFDHAPTVRDVLVRDGLDPYFETVVISSEMGWRKPHRALFDAATTRLRVAAEEAVFVGDNLELDVLGARDAGLHSIWYRRGSQDALQGDHRAIADLAELPTVLER